MTASSTTRRDAPARILVHSQRGLFPDVHYRLGLHEFEDIVGQVDSIDLISPEPTNWFPYGTRFANRMASDFSLSINPGIRKQRVQKDYDLFFAVIQFPKDLLHLQYLEDWKERCKTSICWVNEIWVPDIARTGHFLEMLAHFDYVVVHWAGSVQPLQQVIKRPCFHQPYGIDTIQFCPYPNAPARVVDVYSIGRRAPATHAALLELAEADTIFYVYDTIKGVHVGNPSEHRQLLASTTKRSRYFTVNPGKADNCDETGGQIEFGNRFFEGAASGTIMIGETPTVDHFAKVFPWPDAVIQLPFNSPDIGAVIAELDRDPARQEVIRRTNVAQSLRRHDWVYRWEAILDIAGLQPLPGLLERKGRLEHLAEMVESASTVR